MQKTHEFYKSIGAEIKQLEKEKVVVKLGSFEIHFCQQDTEPFSEYQYLTRLEGRGQGVLFYVEAEDLSYIYKLALAFNPVTQIKENHWNGKEFLIEDPDGYKLIFWSI